MVVSSRNETLGARRCAEPGCINTLPEQSTGRPAAFCSPTCRSRAHRRRHREQDPISVDVQLGSTSSKGRTHGRVWMVRLCRGSDSLIVAIGLSRGAAERLSERMTEIICSGDWPLA
jgi:hypothetical protein